MGACWLGVSATVKLEDARVELQRRRRARRLGRGEHGSVAVEAKSAMSAWSRCGLGQTRDAAVDYKVASTDQKRKRRKEI